MEPRGSVYCPAGGGGAAGPRVPDPGESWRMGQRSFSLSSFFITQKSPLPLCLLRKQLLTLVMTNQVFEQVKHQRLDFAKMHTVCLNLDS